MRIDEGCWCSSLFTLLKSQDGGPEAAKSPSLLQSDFLREEPVFAVPSSLLPLSPALSVMTLFPRLLSACLHPLSLLTTHLPGGCLMSPTPSQAQMCSSPSCTACRGPKFSLPLCLRLSSSLCLPCFSAFWGKLNCLSLGESSQATRSPHKGNGGAPSLCSHNCEQTASAALPWGPCTVLSRNSHLPLQRSSSLAPNTVLGAEEVPSSCRLNKWMYDAHGTMKGKTPQCCWGVVVLVIGIPKSHTRTISPPGYYADPPSTSARKAAQEF